jgi:DNA-binding beta-propeller fold protein YncE
MRHLPLLCLLLSGSLLACGDDKQSAAITDTADGSGDASDGSGDGSAATDTTGGSGDADGSGTEDVWVVPDVVCNPVPTEAAKLEAGANDGSGIIGLGGRRLSSPGISTAVRGFPSNLVIHPSLPVVFVLSTSIDDRRIIVLSTDDASIVQDVSLDEAYYGIALSADGSRLYVSSGSTKRVDAFDVNATTGEIALAVSTSLPIVTSGMTLSADGSRLYVGEAEGSRLLALDTARLGTPEAVATTYTISSGVWDVERIPGTETIVVSSHVTSDIQVVNTVTGEVGEPVDVGRGPMGMQASADGSKLWIAVSGADELVEVRVSDWSVTKRVRVVESDVLTDNGTLLLRSNVNDVEVSPDGSRLYVTRGVDNAVSVLATSDLSFIGSMPSAWYPSGSAVTPDGQKLVVAEGKGFGSGPSLGRSSKVAMDGSVSFVPLEGLDIAATTAQVLSNALRSLTTFPVDCDDFFPVPVNPGDYTPIEHVILVVKENKTFDCVFGDISDRGLNVDPTLVVWGRDITPNQHAFVDEFAFSANFYDEVEDSDMGHITLTSGFLNDFVERSWVESDRSGMFDAYQVAATTTPTNGNLFTHLMDRGLSVQIYGEITGMFARDREGRQPFAFSDRAYPGGFFYSMGARDTDRAEYVLRKINQGKLARFTYMLLPNDHTGGTTPGNPTPEAQVADNDFAIGRLTEGLSQTEYWKKTAIFVVEDDPQGCEDHVDSHRVFAFIISPWAKRGYISFVNYSFQSVFATMTRILGVPPMGRPDAMASPMWDMFSGVPDYSPYVVKPRIIPEEKILDLKTPGVRESMAMDFSGPDRNKELGTVVQNYRLWKMGRISREEAQARIERGERPLPAGVKRATASQQIEELAEEREEEAEEEFTSFEAEWKAYLQYAKEKGEPVEIRTGYPIPPEQIEAVMRGEIPVEKVPSLRVAPPQGR